jgi:membrane-associated PAP2 superfamily phosphatase
MNRSPWWRKLLVTTVACFILSIAGAIHGQGLPVESGNTLPAAQDQGTPPQTQSSKPISGQTNTSWRDVSWALAPKNVWEDQKRIWLFPVDVVHGRHLIPTAVVAGLTVGLLFSDPHTGSYFRQTTSFSGFNRVATNNITAIEMAVVPLTFYGVGLLRKDTYAQKTAIFIGEAVFDSFVVYGVMNTLTRRLRPLDVAPNGDYTNTFFQSSRLLTGSGFPSGHTIAAFSIATVFADRYKKHRWVPWVAYGAACLIGFSRLTLGEHFGSDVFLAAALGYTISHYVVLRGM